MRFEIPYISSDYIRAYIPGGDVYAGEDTRCFRRGQYYEEWIANDFTVFRHGGEWHIIGITHPKPEGFVNAFEADPYTLHEAEWQLFHAVSPQIADGALGTSIKEGLFTDKPKLLYPSERKGEQNEIWAPHVISDGKLLHMIYSPGAMRGAVSSDGYSWGDRRVLFTGDPMMRDPNVSRYKDGYIIVYIEGSDLYCRVSEDLLEWSEPRLLMKCPFSGCCESPVLYSRGGAYYLFWTICDGRNGMYDERTFVFAAENLSELNSTSPLTILAAHASELITDGADTYICSAFYPYNGVNIARLSWR